MDKSLERQEEERIREIAREEIEKYMEARAKYLSLSIIHDSLELGRDSKTNT